MAYVATRLRLDLRRDGWSLVVGALLFGLAAGASLAAAAGAVRTHTVVDRLAEATDAADLLILPETDASFEQLQVDDLSALPGVASVLRFDGFVCKPDGAPQRQVLSGDGLGCFTVTPDGSGRTAFRARSGRLADQGRADELVVNASAAQVFGLGAGDVVDVRFVPELDATPKDGPPIPRNVFSLFLQDRVGEVRTFRVVGVVQDLAEAIQRESPRMVFTQAFTAATGAGPLYDGFELRLDPGADLTAVEAAVTGLVPGEQVNFQRRDAIVQTEERTLVPETLALAGFALAMALAALAVWAQVAQRQAEVRRADDRALAALGARPVDRLRVDLVRGLLVTGAGSAIAIGIAAGTSPLLPVGEARRIEPDPGLHFDALTLLGGAAALVAAASLVTVVISARPLTATRRGRTPSVVRWIRGNVPSSPAGVGIGYALESRGDDREAPTRTTLAGATAGVFVTVLAVTFVAGVDHFLTTPTAYGWAFDLVVDTDTDGGGPGPAATLGRYLDASDEVRAWAGTAVVQAVIDGRPESVMAVGDGRQDIGGTLLEGRYPANDHEVALGTVTARALGVDVGDEVDLGSAAATAPFRVVGLEVLPGLHTNDSDAAALGGGAHVTLPGATRALGVDFERNPPNEALVDLQPGADADAFWDAYVRAAGPGIDTVDRGTPQTDAPAELAPFRVGRTTLWVLAAALGVLGFATVALALVVSVRRRRREFGTLAAVGFTPAQVRGAIVWQASTVGIVAAVVGGGLGVLLGRIAWRAVAAQLGIQPVAATPWLAVLLVAPATVAAANLAALWPAHRAARAAPAESLRTE